MKNSHLSSKNLNTVLFTCISCEMNASSRIHWICGSDYRIVDQQIDEVKPGSEINHVEPGMNPLVKANYYSPPPGIDISAFRLPSAVVILLDTSYIMTLYLIYRLISVQLFNTG